MKIAILTKYGDLAASTRQRFYQYQPYLEETGFEIIKVPFLNNNYLYDFFNKDQRNVGWVLQSYIKRFLWIVSRPDVDLIWLHCDLFPYMPGFFERLLSFTKKPIICDLDDAIFHNYNLNSKWYVRKILSRKLYDTISLADITFCGNQYILKYAKKISSRIKIVPTVVDTNILTPNDINKSNDNLIKIGWIGSPTTSRQYLFPKIPILENLVTKEGGQINVMGANKKEIYKYQSVKFFEWSEKCELSFLQSLDIGIMPLTSTPWARGKCGYKLIQYMSCGLPVIASPVGVNKEIVKHGINGFLAETDEDWQKYIKILINDSQLRKRMGEEGRKKVEDQYSLKVWAPRVSQLIHSVLSKNDTR